MQVSIHSGGKLNIYTWVHMLMYSGQSDWLTFYTLSRIHQTSQPADLCNAVYKSLCINWVILRCAKLCVNVFQWLLYFMDARNFLIFWRAGLRISLVTFFTVIFVIHPSSLVILTHCDSYIDLQLNDTGRACVWCRSATKSSYCCTENGLQFCRSLV